MYLQGDLQTVFDALYHLGVIDPVLEMDWHRALDEMPDYADEFFEVVLTANRYQDDMQTLIRKLKSFGPRTLSYLAMEVAREFADYHARDSLQ